MSRSAVLLAFAALAAALVCGSASADTYSVINTNDSGPGSLRTAIIRAGDNPGRDLITFSPGARGEIRLRSSLPILRGDLEIRGPGASDLTVRRAVSQPFRIFSVSGAESQFVTISGLTISNGLAAGGRDEGGGVLNRGTLMLRRVVISGNTAENGGGGVHNAGTLTLEGSTISANDAGDGGGITNYADMIIVGSDVVGNTAENGGGILNDDDLTIRNSTISRNTAACGGAIFNGGTAIFGIGRTIIWGSTFSRNTASSGGAICNINARVQVGNSTFTGNRALGTIGAGGAIDNDTGNALIVTSSTFAANTADGHGGSISNNNECEVCIASLRATLLANNEAPEGPDAFGPFDSRGYNLIGNPSGSSGFGGTDITDTSPRLDPRGLRDNGGPTRTIAPTAASPAVDAVGEGCPPPATDQRGVSRPQDGDGEGQALCDIGAFEREGP